MNTWLQRPTEVANLLNPAFCGMLLKEFVKSYENETGSGVPLELMFLLLPIVLHSSTREQLPSTVRTQLQPWLQSCPDVRIGFAHRVNEMIPFTRESMIFLMNKGYLEQVNGCFKTNTKRYIRQTIPDEINEIIKKCRFLGRWLSNSSSSTIFTLWGIRP
ncbi:hypothetical protein GC098_29705 [Paenibacillus sp. LMG 31458]|uniref:Uncharacterized protein n=1 Tax=Paenibacillus phytorum TaxID=2654977 RepID=A0ABX1Y3R0_9BACL|nr:three component ABC system middle component [Paenibacillus phytorum]NOU75502.1 hypothetical protein [Paenibacillus phytorum]